MGLDNGVVIRGLKMENGVPYQVEHRSDHFQKEEDNIYNIDLIYMRKWWGVRNEIVDYLRERYQINEIFEIEIDKADLITIRDIFSSYLDRQYFETEEGSTIWSYDEIVVSIGTDIGLLSWLISIYDEHPEIEVTFYDSY